MKIKIIPLLLFSFILVPVSVLAQDDGPIEPIPEEGFNVPVSGSSNDKTKIEFTSVNKSTDRLLGDIKVTLLSDNNTKYEFSISDPPKISTDINIPEGVYKIRASRKGYEDLSDEIDTSSLSRYEISLTPLPKTPQPKLNQSNGNTEMYPYRAYSPNFYDLTSNNSRTIPFGLNTQRVVSGSSNPNIEVIVSRFPYNYSNPDLRSPIADNSGYLYGCLNPNQQYYLSYYDEYHNQFSRPYPFTTPQSGPYSILVPSVDYSRNSFDIPAYNPTLPSGYLGSYSCPNFPYSNQSYTYNQNYQYGQNQLPYQEDVDIDRYYQVIFSPSDGNYYLVNKQNKLDYRKISFVDRGDGEGGFAFFPAEYSGNNDWYVTIYKRDKGGDVTIDLDSASQSRIRPTEYARTLNSGVVESFNEM